jgi:hypothetical protein
MDSWAKRAKSSRELLSLGGVLMLAGACVRSAPPQVMGGIGVVPKLDDGPVGASRSPPSTTPVDFNYTSLDDRPVSSAGLRGKPSVIAFVASDDLASQAEAGFLAAMAKSDGDRVNYALVAVEAEGQRELVESFRTFFESKFGVSLRTAMADKDTFSGFGPFGDVRRLTVVLLDPAGKIAWQKTGLAKSEEIRAALARL